MSNLRVVTPYLKLQERNDDAFQNNMDVKTDRPVVMPQLSSVSLDLFNKSQYEAVKNKFSIDNNLKDQREKFLYDQIKKFNSPDSKMVLPNELRKEDVEKIFSIKPNDQMLPWIMDLMDGNDDGTITCEECLIFSYIADTKLDEGEGNNDGLVRPYSKPLEQFIVRTGLLKATEEADLTAEERVKLKEIVQSGKYRPGHFDLAGKGTVNSPIYLSDFNKKQLESLDYFNKAMKQLGEADQKIFATQWAKLFIETENIPLSGYDDENRQALLSGVRLDGVNQCGLTYTEKRLEVPSNIPAVSVNETVVLSSCAQAGSQPKLTQNQIQQAETEYTQQKALLLRSISDYKTKITPAIQALEGFDYNN